jgi:hypothetical protein
MRKLLPALVLMLSPMALACVTDAKRPLFECDDIVAFELELPMKTLYRRAESRPDLDAVLRYVDGKGETLTFDVMVTTRGHSRLEMCSYPPLSVNFKRKQVENTIFAGQNKLKIVTPCRRGDRYLDFLRQEYGIYRAYNVVADPSFRVRLLEITFRDSEGKLKPEVRTAFFIESIKEVAARSGTETVKQNRITPSHLDAATSSIYEMFQFLIANTDWSKSKGPGDEDCCHNGKALRVPGQETGWVVLPYDFDQAGLINTPYALPHDQLPIRRVSQRLFRGRCEYFDHLDKTITLFNDERADIEAALASGGITGKTLKRQTDYVAKFYDIVNDPKQRKKYIEDRCRGPR